MNRKTLALLLVATVAVTGCTALPTGGDDDDDEQSVRITQNDGLSLAFQSLSDSYLEDGQIVLELTLENTGQREATDIRTELYGASFLINTAPDNVPSSTLSGVDKAAQQSGDSTTAIWRVANPVNLGEGGTQSFPAGVRVLYNYETSASGSFRVVPRRGFEGSSQRITTDNTAGPVQAQFDIDSPKPVSSPSGTAVDVTIPVTVRNRGSGTVASDLDGTAGSVSMNVSFQSAGNLANITDCGGSSGVYSARLFDGSRDVICTASITEDVFDTQLTLQADLNYTYFETQETTFRIEGLAGDQTQ